jgi:CubicO group peptidase (beta-lactamase class C family)
LFDDAARIIDAALGAGAFSAAQLAIGDRGVPVASLAFGLLRRLPTPGAPTSTSSRFDVASLTKIVATTAVTMRLVERGVLDLEVPIVRLLSELEVGDARAMRITTRQLLEHSSGAHWMTPFRERLAQSADPRRTLVELVAARPLDAAPGSTMVYSDLGFMLLGAVCERLGGARLDVLAEELVWEPLGMRDTGYVDLAARRPGPRLAEVAATEIVPDRGLIEGAVHDENAHAVGGIAAHAGVFSTADDLARFCQAYAASWHGLPVAGGFSREVARRFATPSRLAGSTRALGWDTPSPGAGASQAGELWPRVDAVGHGGFTGTSMWLDLPRRRWVVLLTNRVHPSRDDERIKQVRPRVHDAIVRELG